MIQILFGISFVSFVSSPALGLGLLKQEIHEGYASLMSEPFLFGTTAGLHLKPHRIAGC